MWHPVNKSYLVNLSQFIYWIVTWSNNSPGASVLNPIQPKGNMKTDPQLSNQMNQTSAFCLSSFYLVIKIKLPLGGSKLNNKILRFKFTGCKEKSHFFLTWSALETPVEAFVYARSLERHHQSGSGPWRKQQENAETNTGMVKKGQCQWLLFFLLQE